MSNVFNGFWIVDLAEVVYRWPETACLRSPGSQAKSPQMICVGMYCNPTIRLAIVLADIAVRHFSFSVACRAGS